QVLSSLKAEEVAVETGRDSAAPVHLGVLTEDASPTRRQPAAAMKQCLLAATFMEGAERRNRQVMGNRRHNRIGRDLDAIKFCRSRSGWWCRRQRRGTGGGSGRRCFSGDLRFGGDRVAEIPIVFGICRDAALEQ